LNINENTKYGGFWIRSVAQVIDIIIFLILANIISFFLRANLEAVYFPITHIILFDEIVNLFVNWLYYSSLHTSKWQATIGKKLLGMKVVDYSGKRISFGRATARYFSSYLSAVTIIGFLMIGLTKRKQALHDFISKTLVVRDTNV